MWNHFRNKILEILDYEEFGARINIKIFSIEHPFEGEGLPIETLLEEIKPEAIEKSVIEYRQTSKEIDTWDCSGFDTKNRLTEI